MEEHKPTEEDAVAALRKSPTEHGLTMRELSRRLLQISAR